MKVDIIASSSVIPQRELARGTQLLCSLGFEVRSAVNATSQHFAFSGSDRERTDALLEAVYSDSDLLWAARGGYGAGHLLPELAAATRNRRPPLKLLVGYSDVTALYQLAIRDWGWQVLHAPMLCSDNFQRASDSNRSALLALLRTGRDELLAEQPLNWHHCIGRSVTAPLFGGNLAVICSLIGTPWQLDFSGKLLFLEEIGESWSKIDRMLQHLLLSGSLEGCQGIVLGQFSACRDASPTGLTHSGEKVALREVYTPAQALELTVLPIARQLGIPLVSGLQVGHDSQSLALAMPGLYQLDESRGLQLLDWAWQGRNISAT
ncbi:MAG: S66 peptidase family protein [Pseudomonadales bacterium]